MTDAGQGTVDVVILDPHGRKDSVRPAISKKDNGIYNVEYIPLEAGLHSVNVFFAGSAIPGSPFGVGVSPGKIGKMHYTIVSMALSQKFRTIDVSSRLCECSEYNFLLGIWWFLSSKTIEIKQAISMHYLNWK